MYRRREPPDSMSLRYADMSLPDLLGRSRLRYAEISLGITSKCAFVIKTVFSTLSTQWHDNERFLKDEKYLSIILIYTKTLNISYAERKIFGEIFLQ